MKCKGIAAWLAISCLAGCGVNWNAAIDSTYTYRDSDRYSAMPESGLSFLNIATINLSWISGNIRLVEADQGATVTETSTDMPMYYMVDGNVLNLHFVKSGTSHKKYETLNKDVRIVVPKNLKALNINTVAGSIEAAKLNVGTFDIDSVSANIVMGNVTANYIDFDTVSGECSLDTLTSVTGVFSADLDTVSGDFSVGLLQENGYSVSFNTVSGKFSSEYDNALSYGEMKARVSFDSVSGNFTIKKRNLDY